MSTKVLITGAAGMVGSHMIDYLLDHTDWSIVGVLRSHRTDTRNLAPPSDRLTCCIGDLSDPYCVSAIIANVKPDYIFHFAAQSYVMESIASPLRTLHNNIDSTFILLKEAKDAVVVLASSAEVYGKANEISSRFMTEETPYHMASPYSLSKIATDLLGRYFHEAFKTKTLIARLFTHTGPRRGVVFAESNFAYQIARIEKRKLPPVLHVGNLDSTRTWLDVRDAVRAYYLLATHDPQFGQAYNIGGTFTCTMLYVVETLLSMTKSKIEVSVDANRLRPIDADYQVPNTSKFTEHTGWSPTGWSPTIPFEQTMKDLLDYWRTGV